MENTQVLLHPNSPDYFQRLKNIFATSEVRGERIYLRGLKVSDVTPEYVSFFQNEEHIKFMFQSQRLITAESLQKQIEKNTQEGHYHIYGVFENQTNTCIGNITVGAITHTHKISDLAIFIGHKDFIGKGYAQEAIRLGNELCFKKYDFRKLHGGMFADNMASVKAYLKTGWVIEGILQGQYWVNEKAMDRYCVACFNPHYFSEDFLMQTRQRSDSYLAHIQNKSGSST